MNDSSVLFVSFFNPSFKKRITYSRLLNMTDNSITSFITIGSVADIPATGKRNLTYFEKGISYKTSNNSI